MLLLLQAGLQWRGCREEVALGRRGGRGEVAAAFDLKGKPIYREVNGVRCLLGGKGGGGGGGRGDGR